MSDGLYLDDEAFAEFTRLGAVAKTLHAHVERPERDGHPFIIRQHGRVVYEASDLPAVRDWLMS